MPNKSNIVTRMAIRAIEMYQMVLSPVIGGRCACRFYPTCSEYAKTAIQQYGIFRGGLLGLRRLLRCRPGGGSGYDPVP